MRPSPRSHLETVAMGSAVLAVVSAASVLAAVHRAMTNSFDREHFSVWQRPFVDGPSFSATYVGLASLVLLLTAHSESSGRSRRVATLFLGAGAAMNVALGVGYAVVSATWVERQNASWFRPSIPNIFLDELPTWGLAVVVFVVLLDSLPGRGTQSVDAATVPEVAGDYIDEEGRQPG